MSIFSTFWSLLFTLIASSFFLFLDGDFVAVDGLAWKSGGLKADGK